MSNKSMPIEPHFPLVSVVTVCLNSEMFLEQTILSVVNQGYRNIEYIVIDGGSTDGTINILEKFKENINIIISEPDTGIYNAMNKGIKLARGEIIGLINSDDYYADDAIEAVVNEWQKNKQVDVLCGNMVLINCRTGNGKIEYPIIDYDKKIAKILHSSCFVTKSCYIKYGLYNESFKCASDLEFFNRLVSKRANILLINKTLAYFRSGGFSSDNHLVGIKEKFLIDKNYIGLNKAVLFYVNSVLFYFLRKLYRFLISRTNDRDYTDNVI